MKKILILAMAASTLLFSSFGATAAEATAVAVFDINTVAKEAGLEIIIGKELKAKEAELKKELTTFKEKVQAELKKEEDKLDPKDKDKKVVVLRRAAQVQLVNAQRKAAMAMNIKRASVIAKFRDQLKPIAHEVAQSKGYKVLLVKNEAIVFDFANELDLTKDISSSYKAKYPAPAAPAPAPAADAKK